MKLFKFENYITILDNLPPDNFTINFSAIGDDEILVALFYYPKRSEKYQ